MKLRNKKTGEIGEIGYIGTSYGSIAVRKVGSVGYSLGEYYSLTELNKEWEDYEELKDHYYIDFDGDTMIIEALDYEPKIKAMKQIGNYFETKEEAEKAVEKLKAWKRLKDKGFEWRYYSMGDGNKFRVYFSIKDGADIGTDLDFLFGGE